MQHPMLNIAIQAARAAGRVITRSMSKMEAVRVSEKGRNDLVTEVDEQAEQEILWHLKQAFPEHGFLAEESGRHDGNEYCWIIDPLDGTMNFVHGFPQFSISIALTKNGNLYLGLVYDPLRNELFTAIKGKGAYLDNRRIRVSKINKLGQGLIGTGFPYRSDDEVDTYTPQLVEVTKKAAGVRRAGSAALDLAYVACGRLDAFWESGIQAWDVAAGMLLVREAGGICTDYKGNTDCLTGGQYLAANGLLHQDMLNIIQSVSPLKL